MWQNSKILIVTKPKKLWQDWKKNQIVTKLENQIVTKLWQNSKTQIVTKLQNSNCDKTPKLKLSQNSKIQIVTKLEKNSNCDQTKENKIVTKLKN